MSPSDDETTQFEQRSRVVLEESVSRIDAHVRSRLNRARHAALAELAESRPALWRNRAFLPTSVAAAAALTAVALVAWHQQSHHRMNGGGQTAIEDLELLADDEAYELIEDEGAFYEWAAAEGDSEGASG